MIAKADLAEMFDRARHARSRGKAPFDIDQECRWSYFFVDPSRDKLIRLGKFLETRGYEFVGFLEPGENDDDQETLYLRVDKVETHGVESLFSRNKEFYALAREYEVAEYDGMEVGAVESE